RGDGRGRDRHLRSATQDPHLRGRPDLRRRHHHGLRRRLPLLPRRALRGLEGHRPRRPGHRDRPPRPRRHPRPRRGVAGRPAPREGVIPMIGLTPFTTAPTQEDPSRAHEVENLPGFPDGVMGPELMDKMQTQPERVGATVVDEGAVPVDLAGDIKTITTVKGNAYRARSVILANDPAYKELRLDGEKTLGRRGVSYCATCDG